MNIVLSPEEELLIKEARTRKEAADKAIVDRFEKTKSTALKYMRDQIENSLTTQKSTNKAIEEAYSILSEKHPGLYTLVTKKFSLPFSCGDYVQNEHLEVLGIEISKTAIRSSYVRFGDENIEHEELFINRNSHAFSIHCRKTTIARREVLSLFTEGPFERGEGKKPLKNVLTGHKNIEDQINRISWKEKAKNNNEIGMDLLYKKLDSMYPLAASLVKKESSIEVHFNNGLLVTYIQSYSVENGTPKFSMQRGKVDTSKMDQDYLVEKLKNL